MGPSRPEPSSSDEQTLAGDAVERPAAAARALARGDSIGRYLLLDPLGQGAMGQVFRAYDPDLDRQVALKILFERAEHGAEQRDRLLREAKAMARIGHPNVVTVHDAGMHEGSVFIAMELIDGESLDRWLETPRSPDEILDVLLAAARGLAAAHEVGVIHRDFKPANVLVSKGGHAKVGDFGLAGIEDPAHVGTPETQRGGVMGTPAYMSPEHFAGVGIDARSDQFSFAIALFEALHGGRPYSATTFVALASQVITGEHAPALATRRGGLDGLIRRALSVKPEARFATMTELIAALERARRPVWRRWASRAAVAATLGTAVGLWALGREAEADACRGGAARIDAAWGAETKAAVHVGGSDYTQSFTRSASERFEGALDDYAARWTAAYDESCAIVGPRAQRGTQAQQATAQCLENRLESLHGLARLATTEPLDPMRVDDLSGTLPELEDCITARWVPYPADPEQAARAAALHQRLSAIHRGRLMDHGAEVADEARAVVEEARDLGEPYLLALALAQHARLQATPEEAGPMFDEALALASSSGFDRLGARIINDVLMTARSAEAPVSWRELGHLATIGRALVEHGGGDESLQGNLALNEAALLRRAERIEDATLRDQQAEQHFARAHDDAGVAKARLNATVTLVKQGRLDEAIPRLRAAAEQLEAVMGSASPEAFAAQQSLAVALSYASRPREAFTVAADAHRRALGLFIPGSFTLRQATLAYAVTAMNAGEARVAHEAIAMLRALPITSEQQARMVDALELGVLQLEGRHEQVLRMIAELRTIATDDPLRVVLETDAAVSLLALGRREEAREVLADPLLLDSLRQKEDEEHRTLMVFLAALSDAPPPLGTTWRSLRPAVATRPRIRKMLEVADALETSDPVPALRRIRDALGSTYGDHDAHVQVLDAWLAEHDPQ